MKLCHIKVVFLIVLSFTFGFLEGQSLLKAYQVKDLAKFEKILKSNPSLGQGKDQNGCPLILLVTKNNSLNYLKALIMSGAPTETKDDEGKTALMYASRNGNLEMVKYLLTANAMIEQCDTAGNTVVYYCLDEPVVLDFLIISGANINHQNHEGVSILMIAAENSNLQLSNYLINSGADLNLKNIHSESALFYSASTEVAKLLISKGAVPDQKNISGETPLLLSCAKGDSELAKFLIESGASVNHTDNTDNEGWNVLHYGVFKQNTDLVKFLLSQNCKIDQMTRDSLTPIMISSFNLDYPMSEYLLSVGSNINKKGAGGVSPIGWLFFDVDPAEDYFFLLKNMLELFIKNGANINSKDNDGNTPLMYATSLGLKTIVDILMENGADPTIMNHQGLTANKIGKTLNFRKISQSLKK